MKAIGASVLHATPQETSFMMQFGSSQLKWVDVILVMSLWAQLFVYLDIPLVSSLGIVNPDPNIRNKTQDYSKTGLWEGCISGPCL